MRGKQTKSNTVLGVGKAFSEWLENYLKKKCPKGVHKQYIILILSILFFKKSLSIFCTELKKICISFQSKLITCIANVNVDTEKITNPSEGIADRVLDSRSVFIFKLDWDRLNIAREKLNKGKYTQVPSR